jgi:hypothetical protein
MPISCTNLAPYAILLDNGRPAIRPAKECHIRTATAVLFFVAEIHIEFLCRQALLTGSMKNLWTETAALLRGPRDASVPIVAKRLAVRLAILVIFAAFATGHPWNFAAIFCCLASLSAFTCSVIALFKRENFRSAGLTHWDEAIILLLLSLVAGLF